MGELDDEELAASPPTADVRVESVRGVDPPVGDTEEHHHYGVTRHLLPRLARQIDVYNVALAAVAAGHDSRTATDERGLKWLRSDVEPDRRLVPVSQRTRMMELVHTGTN